jgi:hypothetical protein
MGKMDKFRRGRRFVQAAGAVRPVFPLCGVRRRTRGAVESHAICRQNGGSLWAVLEEQCSRATSRSIEKASHHRSAGRLPVSSRSTRAGRPCHPPRAAALKGGQSVERIVAGSVAPPSAAGARRCSGLQPLPFATQRATPVRGWPSVREHGRRLGLRWLCVLFLVFSWRWAGSQPGGNG